jgi:hypothetical protein
MRLVLCQDSSGFGPHRVAKLNDQNIYELPVHPSEIQTRENVTLAEFAAEDSDVRHARMLPMTIIGYFHIHIYNIMAIGRVQFHFPLRNLSLQKRSIASLFQHLDSGTCVPDELDSLQAQPTDTERLD